MYIAPSTRLNILKNVPLDTTYDHTIYFESETAQINYFSGLIKYTNVNMTYQRANKGVIRVERKADNLYDCNYLMFQNESFGNKWFYAFITSVEYVNNITSNIYYEIDVIQTWFFDFQLEQCFVEREHSQYDTIGSNIVPEPVNIGEYVCNSYGKLSQVFDPLCVVMLIVDTNSVSEGRLVDGIYSGCQVWCYNASDVDAINNKISNYAQATDSIVAMYMAPVALLGTAIPEGEGVQILNSDRAITLELSADAITQTDTLDGYKPINKKLYTYPYNFFSVDNGVGQSLITRYEFCEQFKPQYSVAGTISSPVQLTLRAHDYKGSGDETYNAESLTIANYPQCSWNTDSFAAWQAQNSVPLVLGALGSAGEVVSSGVQGAIKGAGVGASLGNPVAGLAVGATLGAAGSALSNAVNAFSTYYKASIQADICRGSVNNGGVNTAWGKQSFYGGRMSVSSVFARIIDDFFTMFGYQTNRVKVPNTHFRPHWNYVKTNGCVAKGSVPADDMRMICDIHNNGITYWKNGNEVGDYTLDNSPIGP